MMEGNFRFYEIKVNALSVISSFKLNMCLWICTDQSPPSTKRNLLLIINLH